MPYSRADFFPTSSPIAVALQVSEELSEVNETIVTVEDPNHPGMDRLAGAQDGDGQGMSSFPDNSQEEGLYQKKDDVVLYYTPINLYT
ncbi:hypothetical protein PG990_006384 [Apiospora arundinis]|uniref:Uncharacterized protein n=1 Tax=Apiospora arundinis TaxID=335852 RepID=A0ABR2JA16_9PEZI